MNFFHHISCFDGIKIQKLIRKLQQHDRVTEERVFADKRHI